MIIVYTTCTLITLYKEVQLLVYATNMLLSNPLFGFVEGPDSIGKDGVYSGTVLSNQLTGNGYYSFKVILILLSA